MTMRRAWFYASTAVGVVVVMLAAMLGAAGLVAVPAAGGPAADAVNAASAQATPKAVVPDSGPWMPTLPIPQGVSCALAFASLAALVVFGPGCASTSAPNYGAINAANAQVAADNVMINLYNALNLTSSEVANLNATFQELLSYYEARAEAVVPYFLNSTWNTTIYDQIAIESGLVPSLIGVETAFAYQQYQDWNATVHGWDAAFGAGGSFAATSAGFNDVLTPPGATPPYVNESLALNGHDMNVSRPFEYWTSTPVNGYGTNATYFSIAPGGTVVDANVFNATDFSSFANYTVYDLTQGFSFPVPRVSYLDWSTNDYPIVTTLHHIGQFDLLKVVCSQACAGAAGPNNPAWTTFETSGAYALSNATPFNPKGENIYNSMVPSLLLSLAGSSGQLPPGRVIVPSNVDSVCITLTPTPGTGVCSTHMVPTTGNSAALGSGPGSAVAGPRTLLEFAATAQRLVNNTMKMAYDYWLTLHAVTEGGKYAIPANCAIPTPSDALPTSTNLQNYNLSANNLEAVYLSYLNAVAQEYGQVFTNTVGFCGDPNLGFSFNWTGSWNLLLNVTASVYLSNGTTPVYLNGTAAPTVSYSNVASWPVYNVDPALLYPEEYQMNVPVGTVYPVPINDPLTAVLVNYPHNVEYGNRALVPAWGVPTYASLSGNGNYVGVSGVLTNIGSGRANSSGDAIEINSCVYKGIVQNPCDISVTYFNNFTIGLVHAVIPPVLFPPPGPNPFSLGGTACGTSGLNSWYDSWAGYVVSGVSSVFVYAGDGAARIPIIGAPLSGFLTTLGCVLGWVALIIVVFLIAWLVVKLVVWAIERRSSRR